MGKLCKANLAKPPLAVLRGRGSERTAKTSRRQRGKVRIQINQQASIDSGQQGIEQARTHSALTNRAQRKQSITDSTGALDRNKYSNHWAKKPADSRINERNL